MFFLCKKKEQDISYLLKRKKGVEIEILRLMFEYAEGKIELAKIIECFRANSQCLESIFTNKKIPTHISKYYISFIQKKIKKNYLSFSERVEFYEIISIFFMRLNIKGNYYNPENDFLNLIISAYPAWVYPDENYFLPIIEKEMPKEISREEQVIWCRNKLLSLYQYDEVPPVWLQDTIWPIYNGYPMVFINQIERNGKEIYYFIDRDSGTKKHIIQST